MAVTTKLDCAHCGSSLKTTKAVRPGITVRCPRCKGVFQILATDNDGLVETIPFRADADTFDLEMPADNAPTAGIVAGGNGAQRRTAAVEAAGSPHARLPEPARSDPFELIGKLLPSRASRGIVAATGGVIGLVAAAAVIWWCVAPAKNIDTTTGVQAKLRGPVVPQAGGGSSAAATSTSLPDASTTSKPPRKGRVTASRLPSRLVTWS